MPPYLGQGPDGKHKNDNKVSGFKSNTTKGGQGFNELRFDDTKDKEQVFVHAEKNMDTRVKSGSMESVGSDKHVTVGGEKDGQKSGEYRERTFKDKHVTVDNMLQARAGDAKVLVGGGDGSGDLDLYVEGAGDDGQTGRRTALQDPDAYTTVEGRDVVEEVSGTWAIGVHGSASIRAKDTISLEPREGRASARRDLARLPRTSNFIKIDAERRDDRRDGRQHQQRRIAPRRVRRGLRQTSPTPRRPLPRPRPPPTTRRPGRSRPDRSEATGKEGVSHATGRAVGATRRAMARR